ncbi:peptidylprolyl isomerase [Stakelama sp. CBK3Z-3]|uniref:peptidylprolyl isomerase n=1 Tax=Stakelama flava TaxID=2860338 RepID=A0ABS6XIM7_9SPHN|nr:peptidylprolyl isomerase [Stakelama flava]MBW4330052.1 peptidylprolyl isomerase [Stakelama flava]
MSILFSLALALAQTSPAPAAPAVHAEPSDAIAADWKAIPADELLVMRLADGGSVVIRLAPQYAPRHVANIRALAQTHWWDGTSVYRVQDGYVTQWGDVSEKKPLPHGVADDLPPEYEWRATPLAATLSRGDPYARVAGFSADGWPLASDGTAQWLPHCYAMVGVARDLAPSTGSGAELYTVIGHAPRHLDRNIALVGRVIDGMEYLSSLPRGRGEMGFYTDAQHPTGIVSVRLASDMPAGERPAYQYRATDNARFAAYISAKENRQPPFFTVPADGADICNVPAPVRKTPGK